MRLYIIPLFYSCNDTYFIAVSSNIPNICIAIYNAPNKIKRETTTPQCCSSPLMTDFIVVRQHTDSYILFGFWFYRCHPTHRPLCSAHLRILGVSHTSGMSSAFLCVYIIYYIEIYVNRLLNILCYDTERK